MARSRLRHRGLRLPVLLLTALCLLLLGTVDARAERSSTFFEFRKLQSMEQRIIVRFMLEGVRAAFTFTGKDWPAEIAGTLRDCEAGWRETLRAMWEPLTPEKDRKSLDEVLFAGYVKACALDKVEQAKTKQQRKKGGPAK